MRGPEGPEGLKSVRRVLMLKKPAGARAEGELRYWEEGRVVRIVSGVGTEAGRWNARGERRCGEAKSVTCRRT